MKSKKEVKKSASNKAEQWGHAQLQDAPLKDQGDPLVGAKKKLTETQAKLVLEPVKSQGDKLASKQKKK